MNLFQKSDGSFFRLKRALMADAFVVKMLRFDPWDEQREQRHRSGEKPGLVDFHHLSSSARFLQQAACESVEKLRLFRLRVPRMQLRQFVCLGGK